jgi:hypothetical protein
MIVSGCRSSLVARKDPSPSNQAILEVQRGVDGEFRVEVNEVVI